MNRIKIISRLSIVIILIFSFSLSCIAQRDMLNDEAMVYSLIDHHYNLKESDPNSKFLYYKTLSPAEKSPLSWAKETGLSEFLMDSVFIKNCRIVETIFSPAELENINSQFSNLESQVLKDEKLSASVLNTKFLRQENYIKVPGEANRKISYPLIIKTDRSVYGLFVEDAHNDGGRFFIYKLQGDVWKVICMDSLWLI